MAETTGATLVAVEALVVVAVTLELELNGALRCELFEAVGLEPEAAVSELVLLGAPEGAI